MRRSKGASPSDEQEKVIEQFVEAVYGEYSNLALASFNEMTALKDATKRITELEADLAEAVELLREVEWATSTESDEAGIVKSYNFCGSCHQEMRMGHAPDCKLAAFLKRHESEDA